MSAVANDNVRPSRTNAFVRFVGKYIQRRREIRAMRALMEMSDDLLEDIGVNRFDIQSAIAAGRGESCADRLSRIVEENHRERFLLSANRIRPRPVDEQVRLAA